MKRAKRLLLTITALLMVATMAACSSGSNQSTGGNAATNPPADTKTDTGTATEAPAGDKVTDAPSSAGDRELYQIEMFNTYANYMGICTGWWAKIIKDELGIEINMISPNVAGTGDALYQTRTAAGSLGDAIVQSKSRMIDCWKAGLLWDMKADLANRPNLQKLSTAYDSFATMFDGQGIYGIPGRVSVQPATKPAGRGLDPEVGAYLRYDWYQSIGEPEIDGIDGLLDVTRQMVEKNPTNKNGDKTYAFSLFADWDGNSVRAAHEMFYMHGYVNGNGYVWMNEDGTKTANVTDDDGLYYQYLKMYNKAYKMGILDPDSSTQNWDTIAVKFQEGRIAFGWWPFLASSIFQRIDLNTRSPYAVVPVKGTVINSPGFNPYGLEGNAFAIGAGAKYPERIMELYDFMASPRGILLTNGQVEGVTYEMKDGQPHLTEFALDSNPDKLAPESMGGGSWDKGGNQINYPLTHQDDPNELLGGQSNNSSLWPSTIALNENEFNKAWRAKFGADNPMEYLQKNNMMVVTPGTDYTAPSEPPEITTIRAQIKEIVQPAGWKMIYAATDDEFEQLWKDMKSKLDDFGYQEMIAYDMEIVKGKAEAIARTMANQ